MPQVNPKMMLPRPAGIERDLVLRRKRAEEEQWLGGIEGIDMTLTFVRTERAEQEPTRSGPMTWRRERRSCWRREPLKE
ncbi:hypothetical protein AB0C40_24100 [Streptomyces brevispora]|uniref:hypothetical protein n=1 Tax=Streptomyces brevispora TaxID=887462 RepID=UPI0033D0C24F